MRLLEEELVPGYQTCANVAADRRIARGVASLERAVQGKLVFPEDLILLDGGWKLIYTNNAPRPPSRAFGDVIPGLGLRTRPYQIIDSRQRMLTNCVLIGALADESIGETVLKRLPVVGSAIVSASARIDLEHSFEYESNSPRITITLRKIKRQLDGSFETVPSPLREVLFDPATLQLPDIVASVNTRLAGTTSAGTFATTFCDDTLRISRGTRELRIFQRSPDSFDMWPPPPS